MVTAFYNLEAERAALAAFATGKHHKHRVDCRNVVRTYKIRSAVCFVSLRNFSAVIFEIEQYFG